jgi:hypothetical protein
VAVFVLVFVAVLVAVLVAVFVAVFVNVIVAVFVAVAVAVLVLVLVNVLVAVLVDVLVAVFVGVSACAITPDVIPNRSNPRINLKRMTSPYGHNHHATTPWSDGFDDFIVNEPSIGMTRIEPVELSSWAVAMMFEEAVHFG